MILNVSKWIFNFPWLWKFWKEDVESGIILKGEFTLSKSGLWAWDDLRNEIFKAKAEKSWNLISKWNDLRKSDLWLKCRFYELMMLNVEVLFCCEPEWLCMIIHIGWFWIEPWAGMAVYDMNIGWFWTEPWAGWLRWMLIHGWDWMHVYAESLINVNVVLPLSEMRVSLGGSNG